ncbi:flagellar basal-body MS-ring/collar protein FliF [Lutibaculum baratangense]|uniref:Flagellar M-ring protein n=1 Tax=Lutibaculum baratangense AMV1 TaxID=631454 RepID=V4QSD5_9HYPH|nr:flagellar basal-body MS-ring/collar protein FliF [Lutibaculum baratangense]ESR22692.1 Flagellar M-ring protein FliF [Lutibaculum baratangense AMV1]
MGGVLDFLKSLGAARLAAMGAVAVALAGFFAFLILRLTAPVMVPLYTELDTRDANSIIERLETQAVAYELNRNGGTILVPEEQVLRLRMELAGSGLPSGGGVGYEIFDRSDGLGTTSFVQNINHVRALEGELTRTIQALERVSSARVHLNLPERELFSREQPEPSASIVVRSRGQLETAQVRAIRHLVASAVKGMRPDRVSIVDETGRLLADGTVAQDMFAASALDERRVELERRVRSHVEEIVSSVVGRDRMRVQVATELDHARVTTQSDTYDPDGRVIRSTQTREEQSDNQRAAADGVTVGNELPAAGQQQGAGAADRESANSTEEVVNYEISKTSKVETTEAGRVARISVAVVIDGNYSQNPDGDVVYEPRSPEELERIAALVRSAVGFSEARGDRVEVVNLRFAEPPTLALAPKNDGWLPELTRSDVMRIIETAILGLIGILVVLFVARPLVRRILAPDEQELAQQAEGLPELAHASAGLPQLAPPDSRDPAMDQVAMAEIAGEVQQAAVMRVQEMVAQNREEAVSIVRNWINEEAAA